MAENTDRYRPGPDPAQRDARRDEELPDGDVDRIVGEVHRRTGRPRLSGAGGGASPTLNVRLPEDVRGRLDLVAAEQGVRPSEVVRTALSEYLERH